MISLYEDSPRSIVNRPIVIHTLPDDLARTRKLSMYEAAAEDSLLACGIVRVGDIESISGFEKEALSGKVHKSSQIEESILSGGQKWENVLHPLFGAAEEEEKEKEKKIKIGGFERSEVDVTKLQFGEAAPTSRRMLYIIL